VGLVSLEAPLISNLPVWGNIALIRQYHRNTPWPEAKTLAEELLRRLDVGDIAEKGHSALTAEERFCAMLLRAATVRDAILVLDRPFGILPRTLDGRYLMAALAKVDDLIAETYIFDYSWEKERYGVEDVKEN
jgi:ABC-type lipopolysaccharide export system ATPase subunit